jgi:hypothetical protein
VSFSSRFPPRKDLAYSPEIVELSAVRITKSSAILLFSRLVRVMLLGEDVSRPVWYQSSSYGIAQGD